MLSTFQLVLSHECRWSTLLRPRFLHHLFCHLFINCLLVSSVANENANGTTPTNLRYLAQLHLPLPFDSTTTLLGLVFSMV